MGISIYTLRYYEKIGLLAFVKRNENGIRKFSQVDIVTLNTVYRLKQTDMTLKDIKHYLEWVDEGIESVPERKAMFQAQKTKVQQQIIDL